MKVIATIITTNLVTNSLLSLFRPFIKKQKQESNFQEVDGMVTKNSFAFCL